MTKPLGAVAAAPAAPATEGSAPHEQRVQYSSSSEKGDLGSIQSGAEDDEAVVGRRRRPSSITRFASSFIVCLSGVRTPVRVQPTGEATLAETGKFTRAHAANLVGCRPAILLASAIRSDESEPR
jgi:hypothetical protein